MELVRDKGVPIDTDPAVGIILLEDTSNKELDTLMNTIIGKGVPEDNVHTVFIKDLDVGVVKIEPNSLTGKGKRGKRITDEINELIGAFHQERTYICLWSFFDTYCSLGEHRIIWFRSERYDEHMVTVTIEFHHPHKSEPMDLIQFRLTDEND